MMIYHEIVEGFIIVKNDSVYYTLIQVDQFPFMRFMHRFENLRAVEDYIDWCEDVCDPLIKSLLIEK